MKVKSTKKALVLSVLSLVVCITMLVGTTFAWFTDSVTSTNNIIKSGNLDVTLEWMDGTEAVADADSDTWQDASTTAIFDYSLWEPGYTCVRHVKIGNEGSLALKYKVVIQANGTVSELADVIDVYYIDPAVQVAERTDISKLTRLGTLTEVLGKMSETASGELAANTDDVITIALKMQESAGNQYMNKEIGSTFSVKVFATQLASENDSFDNTYDNKAVYEEDVQVEAQPWHELDAVHSDTVVDGGGYTYAADYQEVCLAGDADITIKGVTFQNGLTLYTNTTTSTGTITLEECVIYLNDGSANPSNESLNMHNADYGLYIGAISPNVNYVFKNCTFTAYDTHTYTNVDKGYNVYIGGNYSANSITFDGCIFEKSSKHGIGCSFGYTPNYESNIATYYNLTVKGCNFVDWNNGNYDGAAIRGNVPADILITYNKTITIEGNTFGNSNGSAKANVAIDNWNGSWS